MKDLMNHFTPHYAAYWREIGTLLNLPSGRLDIIQYDNHDKASLCCNAMLRNWLEVNPSASWEKLFAVIESNTVLSNQDSDKGIHYCVLCIWCNLNCRVFVLWRLVYSQA